MLIRMLLLLGLTWAAVPAQAQTLAFPNAVGWAKETIGGRGHRGVFPPASQADPPRALRPAPTWVVIHVWNRRRCQQRPSQPVDL